MQVLKYKVCCNEFEYMFRPGTDSEAYGALATMTHRGVIIGSISDTINFCPFCGQKIELVTD